MVRSGGQYPNTSEGVVSRTAAPPQGLLQRVPNPALAKAHPPFPALCREVWLDRPSASDAESLGNMSAVSDVMQSDWMHHTPPPARMLGSDEGSQFAGSASQVPCNLDHVCGFSRDAIDAATDTQPSSFEMPSAKDVEDHGAEEVLQSSRARIPTPVRSNRGATGAVGVQEVGVQTNRKSILRHLRAATSGGVTDAEQQHTNDMQCAEHGEDESVAPLETSLESAARLVPVPARRLGSIIRRTGRPSKGDGNYDECEDASQGLGPSSPLRYPKYCGEADFPGHSEHFEGRRGKLALADALAECVSNDLTELRRQWELDGDPNPTFFTNSRKQQMCKALHRGLNKIGKNAVRACMTEVQKQIDTSSSPAQGSRSRPVDEHAADEEAEDDMLRGQLAATEERIAQLRAVRLRELAEQLEKLVGNEEYLTQLPSASNAAVDAKESVDWMNHMADSLLQFHDKIDNEMKDLEAREAEVARRTRALGPRDVPHALMWRNALDTVR